MVVTDPSECEVCHVCLLRQQKDCVYASVYVCVLMDRQMGQPRGTVEKGFILQLPLSLPLHSKHTQKKYTGTSCVCV